MTTLSDVNLIIFKGIVNFIDALNEVYGEDMKEIQLYHHLLTKTTFSHETAINKHIESFRSFIIANREAILMKDYKLLAETTIKYSEKVYIDMEKLFENSKNDKDITEAIWKHTLTITGLLDPTSEAKNILKQNKDDSIKGETDFLMNTINQIENTIDPSSNPMEAVSSILSSGMFSDLMSNMNNGLQDGSLDLGKLMGSVQNMISSLDKNSGNNGPSFDLNDLVKKLPKPDEIEPVSTDNSEPSNPNSES